MALILPDVFDKNNSHGIKSVRCYMAALYILAKSVFCWTMAIDLPENECSLYIPPIMQLIILNKVYT